MTIFFSFFHKLDNNLFLWFNLFLDFYSFCLFHFHMHLSFSEPWSYRISSASCYIPSNRWLEAFGSRHFVFCDDTSCKIKWRFKITGIWFWQFIVLFTKELRICLRLPSRAKDLLNFTEYKVYHQKRSLYTRLLHNWLTKVSSASWGTARLIILSASRPVF